jgi:hypothetical protein
MLASVTNLATERARLRPPMPERPQRPRLVDAPTASPAPEPAYHPAERRRLRVEKSAADLRRRQRDLGAALDKRGRLTVALLALLVALVVMTVG